MLAPCCPFGAQGDLATLYRKALPELRASAVPVLLLRKLPSEYSPIKSVAVGWADKTGYDVGFSKYGDCGGAPPCSSLHIGASLASSAYAREYKQRARRIRLPDGTTGYFRIRDCSGMSCTEAALSFQRGPYVYEIDEKFGMYIEALGPKQGVRVDVPILQMLYSDLDSL
jgi:hypothetical protein